MNNIYASIFGESEATKKARENRDTAFQAMLANLGVPAPALKDISNAESAEGAINQCRNFLREQHINNIESPSYNYQTGVYYMDIVAELERMGDFIINVSEAVIEENAD